MSNNRSHFKLTPLAEADLENIWAFTFRNWSVEQADHYIRDFITAFEQLGLKRKKGRSVDIRDGYFKYSVGSHYVY